MNFRVVRKRGERNVKSSDSPRVDSSTVRFDRVLSRAKRLTLVVDSRKRIERKCTAPYSYNQVETFLPLVSPRRVAERGTRTRELVRKLETYFPSTNSSRNERVKANLSGGHRQVSG